MRDVTVVLGGGAALGYAHIGVLSVLEKYFNITRIIGTSMGSLVGCLYAYGLSPKEIEAFAKTFKYLDVINPLNIDIKFQGLIDGSFIEKKLNEKISKAKIEDLKIDFSAVAFDLNSKKTIIFDQGNVATACRASSSIPYIFNPVKMDSMSLVDGGIEYPLPILDISENEYVIAVNVLPAVQMDIVKKSMHQDKSVSKDKTKRWYDIIIEAINANQSFLVKQIVKDSKIDIYIDCNVNTIMPTAFNKLKDIKEIGKKATENKLKELNIF